MHLRTLGRFLLIGALPAALFSAGEALAQDSTGKPPEPNQPPELSPQPEKTEAGPAIPAPQPPAVPVPESPKLSFEVPARESWTFEADPALWWVSPGGSIKLPGTVPGGRKIRLERLELDKPEAAPFAEVHLQSDPWRFTISGAAASFDETLPAKSATQIGDVVIAEGDRISASVDVALFEATAAYRFYSRIFAEHEAQPPLPALLNLSVLGGVRLYDVDAKVERLAGGMARSEEFFAEPIAGLRADLELYEDFTIDLQVTAGAWPGSDRSSASLDIIVGFMYWPHKNFGAQIGWRQVLYNLGDGDGHESFHYNGGVAGIYGGIVVRF